MTMSQKITPFLWFDGRAEEAARFYTSIFKNASVSIDNKYGQGECKQFHIGDRQWRMP